MQNNSNTFREIILVLRVHILLTKAFNHVTWPSSLNWHCVLTLLTIRSFCHPTVVLLQWQDMVVRWWGGPTQYPSLELAVAVGSWWVLWLFICIHLYLSTMPKPGQRQLTHEDHVIWLKALVIKVWTLKTSIISLNGLSRIRKKHKLFHNVDVQVLLALTCNITSLL